MSALNTKHCQAAETWYTECQEDAVPGKLPGSTKLGNRKKKKKGPLVERHCQRRICKMECFLMDRMHHITGFIYREFIMCLTGHLLPDPRSPGLSLSYSLNCKPGTSWPWNQHMYHWLMENVQFIVSSHLSKLDGMIEWVWNIANICTPTLRRVCSRRRDWEILVFLKVGFGYSNALD